MVRRILGLVMLMIGISGVGLSIPGTIHGHRLVDNMANGLDRSLDLTSQSLDMVEETLLLAKTTVGQVNDGLDTVESAAISVSQTVSETRPVLAEFGQVASHDVPASLEAVQTAVPDMAQAAAIIDDTLTTLSDLHIEQTVLGFPIYFDLGMNYAPEVSFEESINRVGASLEGISPRLRGLEFHIETTDSNLGTVSQDILAISKKLHAVNSSVAGLLPLLDDYVRIVKEVNDRIQQTRANLSRQLNAAKMVVTIAMVWIGLTQVAPLYLGWGLVSGQRRRW
jgi:ABC-type transporter Mla subunit MlaD